MDKQNYTDMSYQIGRMANDVLNLKEIGNSKFVIDDNSYLLRDIQRGNNDKEPYFFPIPVSNTTNKTSIWKKINTKYLSQLTLTSVFNFVNGVFSGA